MKTTMIKNISARSFVWIIAAFNMSLASCTNGSAQGYKTYSVSQADSLIAHDSNVFVLDVRTPEEYNSETGHIKDSKLIPVQELESRLAEFAPQKNKTIVVYCRSGSRSARASKILSKSGYNVINIDGGINAWVGAGLTTRKGASK